MIDVPVWLTRMLVSTNLDFTFRQVLILRAVIDRPRPAHEIARALACPAAAVSRSVQRLVREGMVEVRPVPGDDRAKLVRPTRQMRLSAEKFMGAPLHWT